MSAASSALPVESAQSSDAKAQATYAASSASATRAPRASGRARPVAIPTTIASATARIAAGYQSRGKYPPLFGAR